MDIKTAQKRYRRIKQFMYFMICNKSLKKYFHNAHSYSNKSLRLILADVGLFYDPFSSAFIWKKTHEGIRFWSDIQRRYAVIVK